MVDKIYLIVFIIILYIILMMEVRNVSSSSEHNSETGQNKIGKGLLIAGICVIIVLLTVIIVLLVRGKEEEAPRRNVVVTQDNVDEVLDDLVFQDYVEPGYYSVSMTTTWHFSTGDAVSEDAYVANVVENTNDIYFDVFLAEDESQAILESPILPRGSELEEIALDTVLPAGTYDCVMVYHLIDEEQDTVSTLRVGFVIIVEQ